MPVDHSKHGFLKDIGTDWVALAANGAPLARAHNEESVRRAAPNAAEYITGKKAETVKPVSASKPKQEEPKQEEPKQEEPKQEEPKQEEPKQEEPKQEEPKPHPAADHDGDGKAGGSKKGENATASKTRRQRKPTA